MKKTYYQILGVEPTATIREIKKAYYKLAERYHPDKLVASSKAEQQEAEAKLKTFGAAFDILRNEESRSKYDLGLSRSSSKGSAYYSYEKESFTYRANEILVKHGIHNKKDLAKQFYTEEQVVALEQVLKNGQPAEDALKFRAVNFPNGNRNLSTEFGALMEGATVDQALKFSSGAQVEAYRLLKAKPISNVVELALKFQDFKQIEVLKQVLANKHAPETALQFNAGVNTPQFKALKEGLTVEQALKFSGYQLDAYRLLKDKAGANAIDLALQFKDFDNVEVLKQVLDNGDNPEDALKFNVPVYGSLGKSIEFLAFRLGLTVEQALQINSFEDYKEFKAFTIGVPASKAFKFFINKFPANEWQSKAYNMLIKNGSNEDEAMKIAIKFQSHKQCDALEQVLKNGQPAEDALNFTADTYSMLNYGEPGLFQFKALKMGLTVAQAMQINSKEKYQALEKLGVEKADLAMKITTKEQLEALEEGANVEEVLNKEFAPEDINPLHDHSSFGADAHS